ncbi:MAG TPA: DHA2 family efflux MFS transporter permease subunit [Steroidobacteraceae bacterium]
MAEPKTEVTTNGEPALLHGTELVLVTIAIALATFMEVLDTTIVNVSVRHIAGTLGVSPSEATWTISSYTLAAAIMQPLTGWISKQFGEVRTFVTSASLFVLFSMLCGLATSMPMLVIGRLMQGMVSGPMVPMAQALLLRSYAPQKRGMAMALWAMVIFLAPIFGPILGGYITDNLSWPWLFYINAPVGIFSVIITWSVLRKRETKRTKLPVDVVGLGLLILGVGALQFMLDNGNDMDWFNSNIITAAAVTSFICLTLLIAWELTDRQPIVDLHLFVHRNFRVGLIALCIGFFAFFGVTVIYPLWLQTTVDYTATWAGLATAPVGVLGLVLMPFVGRNMATMNLRAAATFGFLVFGVSMIWLSKMNATVSFGQLIQPRLLQGVAMAFFFLPLNQIMLSDIRADELASAAGLSTFLRNVSGSIATAVSVWVWGRRTDFHATMLAQHVQQNGVWQNYAGDLAHVGLSHQSAALAFTDSVVLRQAQTMGANDLFLAYGWIFMMMVFVVWLAKPPFRAIGGGGGH